MSALTASAPGGEWRSGARLSPQIRWPQGLRVQERGRWLFVQRGALRADVEHTRTRSLSRLAGGRGRGAASRLAVPLSVHLQGNTTLAPGGQHPSGGQAQPQLRSRCYCAVQRTCCARHGAWGAHPFVCREGEWNPKAGQPPSGTSLHTCPPTGCARRPWCRPSTPTPPRGSPCDAPGPPSRCTAPTSRASLPPTRACVYARDRSSCLWSAHRPLPVLPGCSGHQPRSTPDSLGGAVWGGGFELGSATPRPHTPQLGLRRQTNLQSHH